MVFGPIDFSGLDKNQQDEACDNHLSVFRRSPVMQEFRFALVKQSQELYDENINALLERTVEDAIGFQLDVIGDIVGQSRVPFGAAGLWLIPDDPQTLADVSPVWLAGEPLNNPTADDDEFRLFIKAKIFKNHVKYSSVPEIIEFSRLIFGVAISVKKIGNDDIKVIIPHNFPPEFIFPLLSVIDDETSDRQYLLPIQTGGRIEGAEFVPENAFRADRDDLGPDLGLLTVSVRGLG